MKEHLSPRESRIFGYIAKQSWSVMTDLRRGLVQLYCCRYYGTGRSSIQLAQEAAAKYQVKLDKVLRTYVPRVHKIYAFVRKGTNQLWLDRKEYKTIKWKMSNGKKMEDFSRRDQELYHLMQRDYRKILPIVVFLLAPFGWVYFLIALALPKYLLPHQYLTAEQLEARAMEDYRRRIRHYQPLLDHVQRVAKDAGHSRQLDTLIKQLNNGVVISKDDLLSLRALFTTPNPLALESLHSAHGMQLCFANSLLPWFSFLATRNLYHQADTYRCLDVALLREGLHSLSSSQLKAVCLARGLDPALDEEKRRTWINLWLQTSRHCNHASSSLLLHQAVLLPWSSPQWRR